MHIPKLKAWKLRETNVKQEFAKSASPDVQLDREDARKRVGGSMLKMTCKVYSSPKGCTVHE